MQRVLLAVRRTQNIKDKWLPVYSHDEKSQKKRGANKKGGRLGGVVSKGKQGQRARVWEPRDI